MTPIREAAILNIGKSMCDREKDFRQKWNGITATLAGHIIDGLRDSPPLHREAIAMLDEIRA